MKRIDATRQGGYALILLVLALMGMGGVVLAGFTQGARQQTEHERYLHNQRVLSEAKQALLQFAYNQPVTNGLGPGRLPNADTDNDGISDGGSSFGRLPWAQPNLNLYDIRDADGQRLWYAVSSSFRPQTTNPVNSDTSGTITLRDQSGNVMFDGSNPAGLRQYGIAAVIIAPGAVIARNGVGQDRSVANGDNPFDTNPDTNPGIISASNYLDLVAGTEDNAGFTNSSATDGLILGPVKDLTNDQFIVITAAEVVAMAEQATLQAYRTAIDDYLSRTGGVYPWLYNYDGVEYVVGSEPVGVAIAKLSNYFPAEQDIDFSVEKAAYLGIDTSGGNDGIFGRIPSIFSTYFTEATSQPIDTPLINRSLSLINPATPDSYVLTETYCKSGCPGESGGTFLFYHDAIDGGPTLAFDSSQVLTGVRFVDIDPDTVGNDGRLSATFATPEAFVYELYFFDNDHDPVAGYWIACPAGGDELLDCSRDSSGNPTPGATNNFKSRILHLTVTLSFSTGENNFDFNYANPPTISVVPASATSHAAITATYGAAGIISFPGTFPTVSAKYEYVRHWHEGDTTIDTNNNTYAKGDVDMTGFSLASLTLGMRYYPEIPAWAFQNDWHNSIRMAYALEYEPPGTGPCIVGTTCLLLDDSPGKPRNVASLLVIAGQHDWTDGVDGNPANGKLKNDLLSVFDNGNENTNPTFYRHRGNDKLLVIDEL